MTTEPKLYTETEARSDWRVMATEGDFVQALRERGLIAEEPVDQLLAEAREIAASLGDWSIYSPDNVRKGRHDDDCRVRIALAAFRRGMELAPRKELTREMVTGIVVQNTTVVGDGVATFDIEAIHAALTEALQ